MVNPALLLPVLNTTLLARDFCWKQRPANETQLSPVIYKECREAVASIPLGEKALAPVSFGRSTDSGFQVPADWQYGRCIVQIDVVAPNVKETATFAAILKRAFDITKECVIYPPHLGGREVLGVNDGLKVWVFGVGTSMGYTLESGMIC